MYTGRYLLYGYWLVMVASLMFNVKQHYSNAALTLKIKQQDLKNDKKIPTIINIIWGDDSSKEIYSIFKLAGITPDESQKEIIENGIKNQYNQNGTMGFKYNN